MSLSAIRDTFMDLSHKMQYDFHYESMDRMELVVTIQVNITPNGRMSLPADLRKRLGLSDGGAVFLEETEDGVVLRTAAQAVAHARAIAKRYTKDQADEASSEAFIAHRRTESGE